MNKFFSLFFSIVILTAISCKQDQKNIDPNRPSNFQAGDPASPEVLAGHWINLDFCARVGQYGSVLQTMNNSHVPYAYAFTFNPGVPDSVTCYNAFESWNLGVKYKKDTLELLKAVKDKSVFLMYNSQGDKDMTMFNSTAGRTQMDNFIKSKAGTKDGYLAFTTALNHHLFQGTFTPVGKAAGSKVSFTPGGFLVGVNGFDRFEACIGGDCFLAGQDIDVVTFYDSKKGKEASMKFFGYRYNGGNDTLSIYNLVNSNPAEKGAYKMGSLAYKYSREIAAPAIKTENPGGNSQQPKAKNQGQSQ
jgi:hypothetical protein